MNQDAWDALKEVAADPSMAAQRPSKGKLVRVIEGKQLGVEGTVTWHGVDRFNTTAFRYGDSMTHHLRDLRGKWGYRVRLEPTDGSEPFFIGAEKVCVL